jgi:hypothetical protein
MAVNYTVAVKNARLEAVVSQIGSGGKLEIGTAGMAEVLATFTLESTAGTATSGVLTFSGFPKQDSADATGIAAAARIRKSDNTDIVTGLTVGMSASDIILDNTNIVTNQVVIIQSAAITHA